MQEGSIVFIARSKEEATRVEEAIRGLQDERLKSVFAVEIEARGKATVYLSGCLLESFNPELTDASLPLPFRPLEFDAPSSLPSTNSIYFHPTHRRQQS